VSESPSSLGWPELLARIEADLASAHSARPGNVRDEVAWQDLARRVHRYTVVFLRTRSFPSEDDPDDVVQEVLLKLQSIELIRRLRSMSSPAGYLAVAIRNAVRDLGRRHRLDQQALARLGLDLALEAEDQKETAERSQDRGAALKQALRSLSRAERLMLRMRFWRNQSIGDIAKFYGLPYSTVAVRLFRLLRRLRDYMQDK